MFNIFNKCLLFILFFSFCVVNAEPLIRGDNKPKWEAGLAAGYFYLPDYPGADESSSRFLPLPYAIYRGEVFRADREGGLRGRFLNEDTVEFDVSLGASFPVNSSDNTARQGMPDLDWIGEVGPRLKLFFIRNELNRLILKLPIRSVFATDFASIQDRGYVFNPSLDYRRKAWFGEDMYFYAIFEITHASERLMDYIYEVKPRYATAERPAYDAGAGYWGNNFRLSMSKGFKKDNVYLFGGISFANYGGAKNAGSPLFKDNSTQAYFLGVAWGFYKSDELEVLPE